MNAEIQLGQDASGFIRRGCPACSRHFKVRPSTSEGMVVQTTFQSTLRHANPDEIQVTPIRHCPYCGHSDSAEAFLTPTQRHFVESVGKAVDQLVRYEQLRHSERHLTENPYVTYVTVRPSDLMLEPPIEPNDMTPTALPCCAIDLKIGLGWKSEIFCHECRATHRPRFGSLAEPYTRTR